MCVSEPPDPDVLGSGQSCGEPANPMARGRTAACNSRCRAARRHRRLEALREGLLTLRTELEELLGQVKGHQPQRGRQ